jgi:glycosyltransferase involved in cell wall biosynthesis
VFGSPLGRLNRVQWWRMLGRLDGVARQIAREIDRERYDVVFAQPCMWSQAPLVLRHLQTPAVYYCHEAPRGLYESLPPHTKVSRPWRATLDAVDPLRRVHLATARRLDLEATRRARLVLVNSRFTQAAVRGIYGLEPLISYHGVDAELFQPRSWVQREGYVLSVGAIQAHKGFDFLIESVGRIPEAVRPAVRLVGNAEAPGHRAALEGLAAQHAVRLQIETGIGQHELVERYNAAALLAYAPYNEPFGLVPLEAMACGTPVIGVAEGGVCESVVDGQTGQLVPRDRDRFASAISQLLAQPSQREVFGHQARAHVLQHWSWERAVDRLEQALCATARLNVASTP